MPPTQSRRALQHCLEHTKDTLSPELLPQQQCSLPLSQGQAHGLQTPKEMRGGDVQETVLIC